MLKTVGIPVAVITNASLITDPKVQAALSGADWVSLKVDTVIEDMWRKIDRPYSNLDLHQILDGMLAFNMDFKGILATETMLLNGFNDTESNARKTGRFLSRLQPDIAYISIPTRPPAVKDIRPAGVEALNAAYQILSGFVNKVELLTGYEGNEFSSTGDVHNDILSITSVHPMRRDAVEELLNKAGSDWSLIEDMLQNDEIIQSEFNGSEFYLRSF